MARGQILVGCGRMGGALLRGWLARGMSAADVVVIEPSEAAAAEARGQSTRVLADIGSIDPAFAPSVVVFAVKPQNLDEVAPRYRRFVGAGTVFLSIAAGKPIAFFAEALGPDAAIVRSMPNTPAAVGRGITVACAGAGVGSAARTMCQHLLEAVGDVAWVDDEALLDPVTAVSGSGPAYVFLLIECLAEAGVASGLPADLAMRLARATVIGSGELARLSTDPASVLRRNVTSPGGTTAAALEV